MTSWKKLMDRPMRGECSDELAPVDGRFSPQLIAHALRSGRCPSDRAFDRFLPRELRVMSEHYWTPLAVAVRAAEWLEQQNVHSVVDIGAGTGKFCVAAALIARAHFTGIEHRGRLVSAARELALTFEVNPRVAFVHATFGEASVPEAEAYYMFNPFGENLFVREDRLDEDVEIGTSRYLRDIIATEQLLQNARVGTYLLTYNGFGGHLPVGYREVQVDRELPNVLRMWRKTDRKSSARPPSFAT